jgi:hypothetical protein
MKIKEISHEFASRQVAGISATLYLINHDITVETFKSLDDDQLIAFLETNPELCILLENPSVRVQLKVFEVSPKEAKWIKEPCEELKTLMLFS